MKHWLALVALCVAALLVAACGGTHTVTKTVTKPAGVAPAPSQQKYQTPYGPSAHAPNFGTPPAGQQLLPRLTNTPTTAMYDSVNASVLPTGSKAYAGYTSGWWPTYAQIKARFPKAAVISIAVNASHTAQCLDVEPGDATASQTPGWFRADRAAGFTKPCFYASLSNWPAVTRALSSAGIARSQYFAWDADWTYSAHLDAGFDATQWTDHWSNRNVDASTVTLAFAGLVVAPDVHKPNVMHYERYDPATRHFGKAHARERNTVKTWDQRHCENPVRRSVCKSSRNHLVKLRGRLQSIHKHGRSWSEPKHPWPSGPRLQQMQHRIHATKPIKSWPAGL